MSHAVIRCSAFNVLSKLISYVQNVKSQLVMMYMPVYNIGYTLHVLECSNANMQVASSAAPEDTASQEMTQSTPGRQVCIHPALF